MYRYIFKIGAISVYWLQHLGERLFFVTREDGRFRLFPR